MSVHQIPKENSGDDFSSLAHSIWAQNYKFLTTWRQVKQAGLKVFLNANQSSFGMLLSLLGAIEV